MAESQSTKPERKEAVTSVSLDWKASIVELAGGRRDSDTKESMIARAARAAGISYRTAKSLYYGETEDPKTSVAQKINETLQRRTEAKGSVLSAEEKEREDFREIREQILQLAIRVAQMDQGVASPEFAAAISALARTRR